MKLKYKKMILLTTMSTMGIGLLTLSINQDQTEAKGNTRSEASMEASARVNDEDNVSMLTAPTDEAVEAAITSVLEAAPTQAPTPIPTPTPIPVYALEENSEIDDLFEDYYAAKSSSDVDKLKSLYSDSAKVESMEQLQSKVLHIEQYDNIKSYSKKGLEEGSYITYVYHEIKFNSINTLAPGLAKFYLIADDQGKLKIFSSEMTPEMKEYFDARNMDEDVQNLINMTNQKSEEAKVKDEDLKIFWESLDNLAGNDNSERTSEE